MRTFAFGMLLFAAVGLRAGVPDLRGKTLAGDEVGLAQAVSGRPAVLVVGFSKASGKACQAWEDRLWADHGSLSLTAKVTLVMLEGAPGFVVPFIVRAIKKEKPVERLGSVLVLREGKAALQTAMGFDPSAPDDAYVAVVDAAGNTRWAGHAKDSMDRAALAGLNAALGSAR